MLAVAVVVAAGAGDARAELLACERAILKEAAKLGASVTGARGACEDRRLRGSLPPATDCRTEAKTVAKVAKAESKLRARVAKACGGDDRACGTADDVSLDALGWPAACPDLAGAGCAGTLADCGDLADCLVCVHDAAVEEAVGLAAEQSPAAGEPRCQRAVVKETVRLAKARSQALRKCWDARYQDRHANPCPDPGDGKAPGALAKAESKARAKVCKLCGGDDRACGGGDDLEPASLGFPAHCPALDACGGAVADLDALVGCVGCVTGFATDCAATLSVPAFAPYPPACAPAPPTPTATATPVPTVTPTSTAPTPTFTPGGDPCAASSPAGPVFWVATDGSDATGGGSSGSPWASIQHAVDTVPDGATVLVRPGTYAGRQRLRERFATGIVVRSEVPYQARLRHDDTVVQCFTGQGIALEGFDIAHDGPGAGALVIQVQDLIDGPDAVSRIVFRNNVLHDSFNNDILKVNNGATDVVVERNVFYNQHGSDEHIDANSVTDVVIQDNVFFNDFAASGRPDAGDTSSFIVIKDSNAGDDAFVGAERVTVRRNVFLNWQGTTGHNFVLVGEDGQDFHEARDVLIENNLMLGNSPSLIRAPFGVKGARDVTFRHNTVVGNLPANAYAMRLNQEGQNLPNESILLYNNVWSDPTGTMGDFSDTPIGETLSFALDTNLYWNGGAAIPASASDLVNVGDDAAAVIGDPLLPGLAGVVTPVWDPQAGTFGGGAPTTCAAFEALVTNFGRAGAGSPVIDAARADQSPDHDILGHPRTTPDLGAVER